LFKKLTNFIILSTFLGMQAWVIHHFADHMHAQMHAQEIAHTHDHNQIHLHLDGLLNHDHEHDDWDEHSHSVQEHAYPFLFKQQFAASLLVEPPEIEIRWMLQPGNQWIRLGAQSVPQRSLRDLSNPRAPPFLFVV
jgi:hypothetical protein